MILIIIAVIIVIMIILWVSIYNRLVRLSTYVDESWSQIDVQLKRRNDLIPNLIATTKGYANYEQSTLTKVTQLRQQLVSMNDNDRNQTMHVSDQLSNALKSVFAVSENYPELKANHQFQQLMEELSNTENKIAYSRQLYNSTVASFNMKIKTFPANLLAGHYHFNKREYLNVPDNEKATPKVNFDEFNSKEK